MNDKTLIKLAYLACGTVISLTALFLGYDSKLALAAVITLFGGEKVLDKLLRSKD